MGSRSGTSLQLWIGGMIKGPIGLALVFALAANLRAIHWCKELTNQLDR